MEYFQPLKKEGNNAICSNMDGPRDCHTEWSKSDKEGEIYNIPYKQNLKRNDTNELVYKTETDLQTQRANSWLLGERMGGRDRGFGMDIVIFKVHIAIFKMDNQQGSTV